MNRSDEHYRMKQRIRGISLVATIVILCVMCFCMVGLAMSHDDSDAEAENIIDDDSDVEAEKFIVDGIEYQVSSEDNNTVMVVDHVGEEKDVVIPSSVNGYIVNEIGDRAFRYEPITSVELPNTLKIIGNRAFEHCRSLKSMVVPESVNVVGCSFVGYCTAMKKLVFLTQELSIKDYVALSDLVLDELVLPINLEFNVVWSDDMTVEDPMEKYNQIVKKIVFTPGNGIGVEYDKFGEYWYIRPFWGPAFDAVETVVFSEGIESIGSRTLERCSKVESLVLPQSLKNIGEHAFDGCSRLKEIQVGPNITTMGKYAFAGCSSLKKFQISASTTSISDYAFYGCASLKEIQFSPNITSIGKCSFYGCGLEELVCPETLTSIKKNAFSFSHLVSLTIPDNITNVNSDAFEMCPILKQVTMPVDLKIAFTGSDKIETLKLTPGKTGCSAEHSFRHPPPWYDSNHRIKTLIIEDGIKSIGSYSFIGASLITSIDLPESLVSIGEYAFEGCESIESIVIPETITKIGEGTFRGCRFLNSLTIPISLDAVVDNEFGAFDGCDRLMTLVLTPGTGKGHSYNTTPHWFSHNGYMFTPWHQSRQYLSTVELKEGISEIGDNMFRGLSTLSSVNMPSSLEKIGKNAFQECTVLQEATFPDKLRIIDDYAFYGCSFMRSVIFPEGLTTIGEGAFENCPHITSLVLPNTLTKIGLYTFWNCMRLKHLTVPVSLGTTIEKGRPFEGKAPFGKCRAIETVVLTAGTGDAHNYKSNINTPWNLSKMTFRTLVVEDGVKSIGTNTFQGCSLLTNLVLPNSVTKIGKEAFKGCSKLTSVTFSEGLTTIGESAFEGCKFIGSLKLPDTVTKLGKSAFKNCSYLTDLSVPISLNTVVKNKDPSFEGCKFIEKVTLTKGTGYGHEYGDNTYTPWHISKKTFKTLIVEDGVKSIGRNTFQDCPLPTDLVLPNGVTKIGKAAFKGCSTLTSVTFSEGLTTIGESAFEGCKFIGSLKLPDTVTDLGKSTFKNCTYLTYLSVPISLNTVVKNKDPAFEGCEFIEKVTLTKGTGHGHEYGDNTYTPWHISKKTFRTLVVEDGVESVGKNTFSGCINIQEMSFGSDLVTVGENAFKGLKIKDQNGLAYMDADADNLKGSSFKSVNDELVKQGSIPIVTL